MNLKTDYNQISKNLFIGIIIVLLMAYIYDMFVNRGVNTNEKKESFFEKIDAEVKKKFIKTSLLGNVVLRDGSKEKDVQVEFFTFKKNAVASFVINEKNYQDLSKIGVKKIMADVVIQDKSIFNDEILDYNISTLTGEKYNNQLMTLISAKIKEDDFKKILSNSDIENVKFTFKITDKNDEVLECAFSINLNESLDFIKKQE